MRSKHLAIYALMLGSLFSIITIAQQESSSNSETLPQVSVMIAGQHTQIKSSDTELQTNASTLRAMNPAHQTQGKKVLEGNRAKLRLTNDLPVFQVTLSPDSDAAHYVQLVRLNVKADRREIVTVRIGRRGGYAGFSDDDIIPLSFTKISSSKFDGKGFTPNVFEVKPSRPLPRGEYALVLGSVYYYDFGAESKTAENK